MVERFFLSKRGRLEFAILIIFLHIGGLFVIRLNIFSGLLLALERVILSSYVFVSFERQNRFSTYAGVQYFILGSLPSARLILGFGLFYLQGGSLVISDLDLLFSTSGLFEKNLSECIYHFFENQGHFSHVVYYADHGERIVNESRIIASLGLGNDGFSQFLSSVLDL